MCFRFRLFFLVFTLCLSACAHGTDSAERIQTAATQGATVSTQLTAVAPANYLPALGFTAALFTLVAAIAGLFRERSKSTKMRDAILAKSDQIDKLALSAEAQNDNPGNIVTKFMKAHTKMAKPAITKALHFFDAVRKGLA